MLELRENEEGLIRDIMDRIYLPKDRTLLENHIEILSQCVISLSKKNGVDLASINAKVVVVLHYSPSMNALYSKGVIQNTLNKLVPLGLIFDEQGTMEVFLFQDDYLKLEPLSLENYANYVKSRISASEYAMGGTRYSPVLRSIIEGDIRIKGGFLGVGGKTIKSKPIVDNGDPTLILFFTDSANTDQSPTDRIIKKSSPMNVFIQFIGIGNEDFAHLRSLESMFRRKNSNVGFSRIKTLKKVSDEGFYRGILMPFSLWLKSLE